jgi:hypothetical protein
VGMTWPVTCFSAKQVPQIEEKSADALRGDAAVFEEQLNLRQRWRLDENARMNRLGAPCSELIVLSKAYHDLADLDLNCAISIRKNPERLASTASVLIVHGSSRNKRNGKEICVVSCAKERGEPYDRQPRTISGDPK